MANVLTGTVGAQFDITRTNSATNEGNTVTEYQTPIAIRSLTYTSGGVVAAMAGAVGTAGTNITLSALVNVTVSSDTLAVQDTTAPVVFASLLAFAVYNTHATATITLKPGASNSFLPASEQITIQPGECKQFNYSTAQTITASSNDQIKFVGSINGATCKVWLLGA
jgi:hypothetical protein